MTWPQLRTVGASMPHLSEGFVIGLQEKCKGKVIELAAVDGIDVKRLTDIVRAVLLLQRRGRKAATKDAAASNTTAQVLSRVH
jgi:hypothetical protein